MKKVKILDIGYVKMLTLPLGKLANLTTAYFLSRLEDYWSQFVLIKYNLCVTPGICGFISGINLPCLSLYI